MKKPILTFSLFLAIGFQGIMAEDPQGPLNISADIMSTYVWRGSKLSSGPCVQPYIEYAKGGLSLMVWGSYGISDREAVETDLYASYSFDMGLTLGVNDYYMPSMKFFYMQNHAFEVYGKYQTGGLSLSAFTILNEGSGMAGGDTYLELGYKFSHFTLFTGAGNKWYTQEGNFTFCNLGMAATKKIRITDSFSFPMTGTVVLNPDNQRLYLTIGISL